MNAGSQPRLYVIAGPNGAGKTTFARRFLADVVASHQFINTDLIAAGLSPLAPDTVAVDAGRLMLRRMEQLLGKRVTFGIETTLSGKTLFARLQTAEAVGYCICLVYLWLPEVELAVERVAARVRAGGHGVAADVVRRRYERGLSNLFELYLPLAEEWSIYDNRAALPALVAEFRAGRLDTRDGATYALLREQTHHGRA